MDLKKSSDNNSIKIEKFNNNLLSFSNNTKNYLNKLDNDLFDNNINQIDKINKNINQIKLIEESFEHKHKESIDISLEINKNIKYIKEEINKIVSNQQLQKEKDKNIENYSITNINNDEQISDFKNYISKSENNITNLINDMNYN